ncbi:hypothetical protein GMRT_13346 [Giardia muris]|uniref:Kinetochore protein Spc24 n=1 Tax=Giardia muris TaxID=5742 RepID=A0A4Z1T1Q8_GIAMU|nr:hypothetical protein GMRT_13346 [Giardia muris]|eukprot:TNJ26311.1 hypothetical protein GMRT_13346 [Giardia muris]
MDQYSAALCLVNELVQDMERGGELSLCQQIIEMRNEINAAMTAQQGLLVDAIHRLNGITQAKRSVPHVRTGALTHLKDEYAALEKQCKEMSGKLAEAQADLDTLLANQVSLRDNVQKGLERKQAELEEGKVLIQLYHTISGVHWDRADLGYVLSEEIAKPIRFDDSVSGTAQLWEMINL